MREPVRSGVEPLDRILQDLRIGDNVVWQVDDLDDYRHFAGLFVNASIADGYKCVYLRFAPHPPVLEPREGLETIRVDPGQGFDLFSREVHDIIEKRGRQAFYVLDNLSALVEEWATDELLANFFQSTCPYLFEMDTVTYFALTRGRHAHGAVARIRDTTQILLDVFKAGGKTYLHPLKVWDRYSQQMFLPHEISSPEWKPVSYSGEAAAVSSVAIKSVRPDDIEHLAPWESIHARLLQRLTAGPSDMSDPELSALKQEMCRILIGGHPDFNLLAEKYIGIGDLLRIRERMIGTGRIGGKAAGMLLARSILLEEGDEELSSLLEAHDSFYIGSDVFFTFLVNNGLFRLRLQLTRSSLITHEEFAEVEKRFRQGTFPPSIMARFRDLIDYFGQAPVIVRSSSLLEDSFGNAFAGKYSSVFCANQGDPDERLEYFLQAVKEVYASTLNPDALAYRRRRGLGDSDEQMAILVQRVSGAPYKNYFFPALAGVAFSRNMYAWSDRIDPMKGVIRLVAGLGTRAVDRVGGDYPRMIAISQPQLRPEAGERIAEYSQHLVDLLDLENDAFVTLPFQQVFASMDYPGLNLLVSVIEEDFYQDPVSGIVSGPPEKMVLTFNNLLKRTAFVRVMGGILEKLERAYGHPVDIEFTAKADQSDGLSVNLLQCRPLFSSEYTVCDMKRVNPPPERVLFRSRRMIGGGAVRDIRYILYVPPEAYADRAAVELRHSLGRVVGRAGHHPLLAASKLAIVGPGRWGSSNIDLGVNVGYADIENASVIAELARSEAGHAPEVSYGTHFFQDIVESGMIYLSVFPDDEKDAFARAFFADAPGIIDRLLPEDARFSSLLKVIDVLEYTGSYAHVAADPQSGEAVCYLA